MDPHTTPPPPGPRGATLTEATADEQRQALGQWRRIESGIDGRRISELAATDDPVAHKLLDAAGDAIAGARIVEGLNILRLIVRDYRQSQEAALARQAIDQIRKQAARGR